MARIKDIVEQERNRSDMMSARRIHLYAEGTFCHAYEWSAWLWQRFIKEFKVTHTLFKDIEEPVAMIGCPVTNLENSVPSDVELQRTDEKVYDLVLPESMLPADYSIELMQKEFDAWKQVLPEAKPSNSRKRQQTSVCQDVIPSVPPPLCLTDIMRSILSYDINRHTPFESVQFLSDIKQQLIRLI